LEALPTTFGNRIGISRAKGATRRFAFNAEFAPSIRRLVERIDPPPTALDSKLADLNEDLESAKTTGSKIIGLVVERDDKLRAAHKQSEVLGEMGDQFRAGATTLQRQAMWAGAKAKIAISLACVCMLCIFILIGRRR